MNRTGPAWMHDRRRARWGPLVAIILLLSLLSLPQHAAADATLPAGFQEETVFSGLSFPTAARFAPASDPEQRVFVAEKRGRILAYRGVQDPSPTQVVNLQQEVYNFSDRGLLGLAVDPGFPGRPYLYALYTRDAIPGGGSPYWGSSGDGYENESCAGLYCLVTGRLVKITIDPDTDQATATQPLITDWCNDFFSHSVGNLAFDPDGQLWVSGGDGAGYDDGDYGQLSDNACGDPIQGSPLNPVTTPFIDAFTGAAGNAKEAEGGALRSQDLRTTGDPTGLGGSIIRIDPDTGAASPGNPAGASPDLNTRRIVAYGLRNPFRFAVKPGTREVWTGDVGWTSFEEVNRIPDPTAPGAGVRNFGWPCYEGDGMPGSRTQGVYRNYDVAICERLYQEGQAAVTAPAFSYAHALGPDGSSCSIVRGGDTASYLVGSSASAVGFYDGGDYGAEYEGGLFVGDYARQCIWFIPSDEGEPDPSNLSVFAENAGFPVDIQRGPEGDLFYVDIVDGLVKRIRHTNIAVSLRANGDQTSAYGAAPLNVPLTATVTGNSGGDPVTFAWDFDGDGSFGDGGVTTGSVSRSFAAQKPGVKVRVRVTVAGKQIISNPVLVASGDLHAPTAQIDSPSAALTWAAGQDIAFAGKGLDAGEPGGQVPEARMSWDVVLQHCPGGCHQHVASSFPGKASGSFTAQPHEYPSYLTLRLTVADEYGLTSTKSIDLQPQTVKLTLNSEPAGLSASAGVLSGITPLTTTLIRGSSVTVATSETQVLNGRTYRLTGWSDGGAPAHQVTVGEDTTLTARFSDGQAPPAAPAGPVATPAKPAPPTPKVRRGASVKVGPDGIATLGLRCPVRTRACTAALVLRTTAKKPAVLGRRTVKIGARKTARVRLKLSPSVRRTLKRKRRLTVQSTVVYRAAGRAPVTDLVRFQLLARR